MSDERNVSATPANPARAGTRTGMSAATRPHDRVVDHRPLPRVLVFVFQPVSPALHALGMVLVVVGALAFNLVPLCRPGRPVMGLVRITAVIAVILMVAIAIAMGTANLYGDYVRATACPNEKPGSRNWDRKLKCEKSRWLICGQIGPDTKPAIVEWCAASE